MEVSTVKVLFLSLIFLGFRSCQQIREPNCFNCFANGPNYFYCQLLDPFTMMPTSLATCCEPGATSSECNYSQNNTLKCSA